MLHSKELRTNTQTLESVNKNIICLVFKSVYLGLVYATLYIEILL